jgi:hypothetical protein
MQTLRTSASDIDALRYYLADDDGDIGELLARLRKEEPPTAAMLAGTALHDALEHCDVGEHGEMKAQGHTFFFQCDGDIDIPAIREVKATRDYMIDGCAVTLVGKVDGIHGKRIDDHKLTSRYDAERFLNTYQWRVYLDVFGADEFRWNIFEGRPDAVDPKRYTIFALHQLRMHRYPGMGDDIEKELRRFVDFARTHLPERIGMETVA